MSEGEDEISIENFETYFPESTPRFTERATIEALKETGINPSELKLVSEAQLKKYPQFPGVRETVEKSLNLRRSEKLTKLKMKRDKILGVQTPPEIEEDSELIELRERVEKEKELTVEKATKVIENMIINQLAKQDLQNVQEYKEKQRIQQMEENGAQLTQKRKEKGENIGERAKKAKAQIDNEEVMREKRKKELEGKWANDKKRFQEEQQKKFIDEKMALGLKRKEDLNEKMTRKEKIEKERLDLANKKVEIAKKNVEKFGEKKVVDLNPKILKAEDEIAMKKKTNAALELKQQKKREKVLKEKDEKINEYIKQVNQERVEKLQDKRTKSIEKVQEKAQTREKMVKEKVDKIQEQMEKEDEIYKKVADKKIYDEEAILSKIERDLKAQFAVNNSKEKERERKYYLQKKEAEKRQQQEKASKLMKTKQELLVELKGQTLKSAELRKTMIDDFNALVASDTHPDFTPLTEKYGLNYEEMKAQARKKAESQLPTEVPEEAFEMQRPPPVKKKPPVKKVVSSKNSAKKQAADGVSSFNLFENPDFGETNQISFSVNDDEDEDKVLPELPI